MIVVLAVVLAVRRDGADPEPVGRAVPLVVVAGNGILTTTVKDLADRVRPAVNPIAETLGPSFPSGHSSWSAAFFAAAALLLEPRPRPPARAALAGAAAGLTVMVAGSRVLLERALAERRDRGSRARLRVVLGLRDRVRRTPAAVRRAGRGGRACRARRGRRHAPPELVSSARCKAAVAGPSFYN